MPWPADSQAVTGASPLGALDHLCLGGNQALSLLGLDKSAEIFGRSISFVPFATQQDSRHSYNWHSQSHTHGIIFPHSCSRKAQRLDVGQGSAPSAADVKKAQMPMHLLPFPSKLFLTLSISEYHQTVSWVANGWAWKIHDADRLVTEILPLFFDGSYAEILMALIQEFKRWGFRHFAEGPDSSTYYHYMMRPVIVDECKTFQSIECEHDFYALSREIAGSPASTSLVSRTTRPDLTSLLALTSFSSATSDLPLDGKVAFYKTSPPSKEAPTLASLRCEALQRRPSVDSLDTRMANELLMARELHGKSINRLAKTKGISKSDKIAAPAPLETTDKKRPRRFASIGLLPRRVDDEHIERIAQSLQHLISYPERSKKKAKTAETNPNTSRREWLPPLGPPGQQSPSASNYDWLYTSSEAFATLCSNKDGPLNKYV